jgi:CRP/FNR family transcriptional regulator
VADDVLPFPLRQEDIADALGLTHAHVNRTLKSLRDAGIITYDQGVMRILDVPTLHRNVPRFVPLSA